MALTPHSPEYQAFAKFARLTATKKELLAQIDEIKPQLKALEPILLGYLGQNGYQMVKVEGFTMSPHREPWVYPKNGNREAVCEALKLSGLGRFVREVWQTSSLTKYVRELEEHHKLVAGADPAALEKLLPLPLAQVLEVKPGYRLQVLDRRHVQKGLFHETETETETDSPQGDSYDEDE